MQLRPTIGISYGIGTLDAPKAVNLLEDDSLGEIMKG